MSASPSCADDSGLPSQARPGQILAGKYRIERVLGMGGMGVVVAATHVQLDQRVAVKFLLPQALHVTSIVERFAREARAAASLRSKHAVRVFDVGTSDEGIPYMVMEYLEGEDLHTVLQAHSRLPVGRAARYVIQACDALSEAHRKNIVHRDIKPQNLFLSRSDRTPQVKVLDFGISKVLAEPAGKDPNLTATSIMMGSPNYMAPEQMRSAKDVDHRADVWALGVVLYKCITGQVPFEGSELTELCWKVVNEPPRDMREFRPDVDPELVAIVQRCLAKDPADRFQSVDGLALALGPFADHDEAPERHSISGARPSQGPRGNRLSEGAEPKSTSAVWTSPEQRGFPIRKSWAVVGGLSLLSLLVLVGFGSRNVLGHADPAPGAAPTERSHGSESPPGETRDLHAGDPAIPHEPPPMDGRRAPSAVAAADAMEAAMEDHRPSGGSVNGRDAGSAAPSSSPLRRDKGPGSNHDWDIPTRR